MNGFRSQIIGVDIRPNVTRICRFNPQGNLCFSVCFDLPQPAMPGLVTVLLGEQIEFVDPKAKADIVGISLPCQIDPQGRISQSCTDLPGWTDVTLSDWLEPRLSRKVTLINSAKCARFGISHYSSGNCIDKCYCRTLGAALLAQKKFNLLKNSP